MTKIEILEHTITKFNPDYQAGDVLRLVNTNAEPKISEYVLIVDANPEFGEYHAISLDNQRTEFGCPLDGESETYNTIDDLIAELKRDYSIVQKVDELEINIRGITR